VTPTGKATGRCDFGQILLLIAPENGPGGKSPGKSRERVVMLRNTGTTSIEIERLESSCGCTTAMLPAEGGVTRTRLAPGEKIALRIALHTETLKPGPLRKWVWVRARHQAQPIATLAITAFVQAPATFTPATLDFGRVPAGEKRALRLTATTPVGSVNASAWHLASTNPDVRIEDETAPSDVDNKRSTNGHATRTFTVTLAPDALLGRIEGALRLVAGPSDTNASHAAIPVNGGDADAGSGLSVPLAGEVSGSLSAMPRVLVLGSTPAGKAVTRQVIVQGETPDALRGLQISSTSPSVSARLLPFTPPPDNATATTVTLAVTLADTAPAGGFQADVIVTTRTGQRLRIIVLGSVIASGR
jgi:Protein of unknown function (DUF1573)